MNEKTIDLQNRLMTYIRNQLPITANGKTFNFEDLTFVPPAALSSVDAQLRMQYSGKDDLKGWIRGKIIVTDQATGQVLTKSPMVNLVPVYAVTDRGTYMVKGTDKTIISSMRLKPGVYTSHRVNSPVVETNFRIDNSQKATSYVPGIEMAYDPVKSSFSVEIKGKPSLKVDGVNFLRELGFSDQEITRAIGNDRISDTLMGTARSTKSINEIYRAVTGLSSKENPENTRTALMEFLSRNATFGTGSENLKDTIGITAGAVNKDVVLNAVKKMFSVVRAETPDDVIDDLRFKEVLDDNDLLMEEFQHDFNAFRDNVVDELNKAKGGKMSYSTFSKTLQLGNRIDIFMRGQADQLSGKSPLVRASEQTNPLFMASIGKQVSQIGGPGGMSSDATRNALSQRNLKGMGLNRLDPVETPESGSIGLVERLSQAATIKDKTIYVPVLKVFGKEITDSPANTVELSPTQEYNAKVAYFDSEYVKRQGNKIIFTADLVPGRYQGKNGVFPVSEIQYLDKAAQNIFSYSANLIPFVIHDDGNRVLMGTNMQRDAMVLKNRELPLVSTSVNGTGTTYEKLIGEEYGKPVRSSVDGKVTSITDTEIVVKDDSGKAFVYPYYKHFKTGQSSINNELKVKAGDTVKNGQILAEGWQTIDGELALGVNARTGYLSYKGYNNEDGIVISRSFADKMTTEELNEFTIDVPAEAVGGRGSKAKSQMRNKTTKEAIFTRLDDDGIIRSGEKVKPGDIIAAILVPKKKRESGLDELLGNAFKSQEEYVLREIAIPPESYLEGRIERINTVDNPDAGLKQRVIVTIISEKPMVIGDKISGKHGNKGTITKILPDEEMPVAEDGRPLEVVFSPLTVPSRKNPGQMYEVGAGLIAEKKGERFIVNNFDKNEKNRVLDGLKEIGVPDGKMFVTLKERQADGSIKDVKTENPVTVGNMYVMKLSKKSEDKIQARSNYEGGRIPDPITYMPTKSVGEAAGEKHNPQSIGEMEMRALQAHGAVWNILESTTVKADGGGDITTRLAIFEALKSGKIDDLDMPATPQSLKATADSISGMGLKLQPMKNGKAVNSFDQAFDAMSIVPIKGSEFIKTIGAENEVTEDTPMKARMTYSDVPTAKGVLDPAIFGERGTLESREKWGYIKLATPIPNPVLFNKSEFNPYSVLTGVSATDLQSLVSGGKVVVIDPKQYNGALLNGPDRETRIAEFQKHMEDADLKPGDIIAASAMNELIKKHGEILWKAGGEGIQFMLDGIDINQKLKETKKLLDNAKGTQIDNFYKKYKMLDTLKKNGMEASDLMMQYVPVTPTYLRPVIQIQGDEYAADATVLYGRLIRSNEPAKDLIENGSDLISDVNPESASRMTSDIYRKVEDIMGVKQYVDRKKKSEYKGLKQMLGGKYGTIRGKLLKKRVDFSGRAVIGIDPELHLNEVGLPIDMATTLYKPFIYKELLDRGYAANYDEARSKVEQKDAHVRRVLADIVKDRPVLMNRQPSLHEQSIMAMQPVIKETQDGDVVRNIHLNPLVVTAYGADFDGDQMSAHLPITDRAKEEAKRIMMPTENMVSSTNGKLLFQVRQEMIMGIYYLTKDADKPKGESIRYGSYSDLKKDYLDGKIRTNQNVSIGALSNVTAGYALFILLIPLEYRTEITTPGGGLYHPVEKPWDSKSVNGLFVKMSDDCEATNGKKISRMQIANLMDEMKSLGFDASTKSGISLGLNDLAQVENVEKLYGKAIDAVGAEEALKYTPPVVDAFASVGAAIEDKLRAGLGFAKNNPANLILMSGARGNPQQFRKMVGTVGLGADITGKVTEPVKSSFMQGLSPEEYWTLSADSRKGIYDRSVATFAPGKFTREFWSATQDMIITEKDCGTKEGILMDKRNASLVGRVLLEDLVLKDKGKIAGKGDMVTKEMWNAIYKDDSIDNVRVRSPLKCKTIGGICQKCYGATPGSGSLVPIGTAVGVIASQSFGEPFTQGTLNTFHTGGMNSGASSGLPRVDQILNLSKDNVSTSVLASISGTVTKIDHGMRGTFDTVYINEKPHKIIHVNGEPVKLKVKEGDLVTKGDFLTVGDISDIKQKAEGITSVDPRQLFKLRSEEVGDEQARSEVQDVLLGSLSNAVEDSLGRGAIDQRHMEVMLSKMTSKVKITDPGDSTFLKGETIDKNEADLWNKNNCDPFTAASVSISDKGAVINKISREDYKDKNGVKIVGKNEVITEQVYRALSKNGILNVKILNRPIHYENLVLSKNQAAYEGNQNFFSALGTRDIQRHLQEGAAMGLVDKLSDPRGRLMTGKLLNIGEGFSVPRAIADSISTRMKNIFAKD